MTDVKKETIIRTAALALALVNQALTATGHSVIPVSDEQLAQIITLGITAIVAVWAWWKNNSFTKNAIKADDYLEELNNSEESV